MPDRLAALLGLLFRWVCLLYPREFRRLFLGDMTRTFAQESAKAYSRGGLHLFGFCVRNFLAAPAGALAERYKSGPLRRGGKTTRESMKMT